MLRPPGYRGAPVRAQATSPPVWGAAVCLCVCAFLTGSSGVLHLGSCALCVFPWGNWDSVGVVSWASWFLSGLLGGLDLCPEGCA